MVLATSAILRAALAAICVAASVAGQQLTRDLHSLAVGNPDSDPQRFVQVGADTYFTAHTAAHGTELYRRDGVSGVVAMVADLRPGGGSSTPRHLTAFAGRLYFTADDGVHGTELWSSDGTAAGTQLARDVVAGAGGMTILSIADLQGVAMFTADDGVHGLELWRSDGTALGTSLVADIRPGPGGSLPSWMTAITGNVWFEADDGAHGAELWKSDGTALGTVLVQDLKPGPQGSGPQSFVLSGGGLFFTADDGVKGTEVWTVPPGATFAPLSSTGCGAPLRTPTLEVSTPALGGGAVCSGVAAQPGAPGLLVVARPGPVWQVTPACATHLDLSVYAGLATFAAAAGGDWQVSVPLPNAPYLQGLQVAVQAVFAPTLGPRGFELSVAATATLQ